MWKQDQVDAEVKRIADWATSGRKDSIIGSIAVSLLRIANAQEALVELSQTDLQNAIESEIQARAETMANEMQEEKTKRSFIGKRP